MTPIDPIAPRPIEPVERRLGAPPVRERYLDEQPRERERRRQGQRRPQTPPQPPAGPAGSLDVRA